MAERPFRFLNIAADRLNPRINWECLFSPFQHRALEMRRDNFFLFFSSGLIKSPSRTVLIVKIYVHHMLQTQYLEPLEAVEFCGQTGSESLAGPFTLASLPQLRHNIQRAGAHDSGRKHTGGPEVV